MAGPDTVQGFLDRIDRQDACWRWPGTWHANGYPLVKFQGRQWLVHRLAYNLLVGPLEPGQQLSKACGGPGCVRPGGSRCATSGAPTSARVHAHGLRAHLPQVPEPDAGMRDTSSTYSER